MIHALHKILSPTGGPLPDSTWHRWWIQLPLLQSPTIQNGIHKGGISTVAELHSWSHSQRDRVRRKWSRRRWTGEWHWVHLLYNPRCKWPYCTPNRKQYRFNFATSNSFSENGSADKSRNPWCPNRPGTWSNTFASNSFVNIKRSSFQFTSRSRDERDEDTCIPLTRSNLRPMSCNSNKARPISSVCAAVRFWCPKCLNASFP